MSDTKDAPVRFPEITVQLSGEDGNAFAILARVRGAMKAAGLPAAVIEAFTDEASSGDYDDLLRTCMRWVTTL